MYLKNEEIEKFIQDYDKDTKALKNELAKICWYMRGSIGYTEAHLLSYEERVGIAKLIEENLETTKTTGLPFF